MYNRGNNSLIDPIFINQFLPISCAISEMFDPITDYTRKKMVY